MINGAKYEPFEILVIDVPESFSGKVIELVCTRKGELCVMEPKGDLVHIEFNIPSRGLIGLRSSILTITSGEAMMNHRFKTYEPFKGDIPSRVRGSLVSLETGQTSAYAIDRLQDRGRFFIDAGESVYKGQVVGEYTREGDLGVNVMKGKKLTNMRASGSDESVKIAPRIAFSLEEALEYIKDDEYLEITPKKIRIRKMSPYLNTNGL